MAYRPLLYKCNCLIFALTDKIHNISPQLQQFISLQLQQFHNIFLFTWKFKQIADIGCSKENSERKYSNFIWLLTVAKTVGRGAPHFVRLQTVLNPKFTFPHCRQVQSPSLRKSITNKE